MHDLFGYDKSMNLPSFLRESVGGKNLTNLVRRIRAAVDNRKVIRFDYIKPDADKSHMREVWPLAVFFRRHSYYMFARCINRESIRLFRVSRISKMVMTRKSFPIQDFSLEDYLESAFELNSSGQIMDVEIHFKSKVAPFIRELVWHPSQTIEPGSNNSLVLRMTVAINQEIVRWILGFGSECTVIAPQILISMIKEHVDAMNDVYSTE